MSNNTEDSELRDFIGTAMYGVKYYDYCLTPVKEPKGKYPYPEAIAQLDAVMARIEQRELKARLNERMDVRNYNELTKIGVLENDQRIAELTAQLNQKEE